jgi:glycosyltransferase involved in cell wall biosynthesis
MGEAGVPHDVEDTESHPVSPRTTRSLSVVIPCFNEEEILTETVDHVLKGVEPLDLEFFELLLCENGSTDNTLDLARELESRFDPVRVVPLEKADYGAAMKAGFLAARGDVIVNFDADYYDMDFLDSAMRVDGDIVVAAKGVLGSHDTRIFARRLVSKSFGMFVRRMLGVQVTETHGMKLFHKAAIADLLPQIRSTKDLFDTELLARSEWTGLAIRELPIRTEEIRHSRSGILRRIPRTIWGLVKMRVRLRKAHSARIRVLPGSHNDAASPDVAV